MNAFQRAKHSIAALRTALTASSHARASVKRPSLPRVAKTRIVATSHGMFRIVDAATGRVLGFRQSMKEARWYAEALERGVA